MATQLTQQELDKILAEHTQYCTGFGGIRADFDCVRLFALVFKNVDLSHVDFSYVNLTHATFENVNLWGATFSKCTLDNATFRNCNLDSAHFTQSSCYRCEFIRSNLDNSTFRISILDNAYFYNVSCIDTTFSYSYLENAKFDTCNFKDASFMGSMMRDVRMYGICNFKNASFIRTNLDTRNKFIENQTGVILKEPLIGYKKTYENVVITVEIPAGAIVFSVNGGKCRTNKAKIIDMKGNDVLHSKYNPDFEYTLNKEIEIDNFDLRYNIVCAPGFHFFKTYEEAEHYVD